VNPRPARAGPVGHDRTNPSIGADDRPRLVVATRSAAKLRELGELLDLPRAVLLSLDDVGVPPDLDVPEEGRTFAANARTKARAYARRTGLPTLADDSGLEVDALGGGPGVRTRRFAGERATDAENNARLLEVLAGVPPERRGARYVCVLAVADPGRAGPRGGIPIVAEARGTCRGRIALAPRGTGGFGYDPLFEPAGEPPGGRTFGEYTAEEKHRISHRGRATRRLRPKLVRLGF
jgi:XTP/dITP diphosphohydrolase